MENPKTKQSRGSRRYPINRISYQLMEYGSLEENLISEIKKETVLYDKTCVAYRKIEATEEAWKRVSNTLGISVDSCKKRWKSLRDCYIKHYRAQQQHSNKKSWPYYDHLNFLAKHIQLFRVADYDDGKSEDDPPSHDGAALSIDSRVADNGLQLDESLSDANFIDNQSEYIQVEEYDEQTVDASRLEGLVYAQPAPSQSKAMATRPSVLYLPQPTAKNNSNSDERFLLSCAPTLQRLSQRKNALVRLKIQQLLYEMEFGDEGDEVNKSAKKSKLS